MIHTKRGTWTWKIQEFSQDWLDLDLTFTLPSKEWKTEDYYSIKNYSHELTASYTLCTIMCCSKLHGTI